MAQPHAASDPAPTMRALRVASFAPGTIPTLERLPLPACKPGEVRIRVQACGVSFVDLLLMEGAYQIRPALPFVPGSEFSGVVDAVADPKDTGLQVGDRVCGTRQGAWAEYLNVPAHAVQRLGPDTSWHEAAVLVAPYATALYALRHRAHLAAGETLLVLGAGGAVGQAAVQLGKLLGARVLAGASTPAKRSAALAAGAHAAVDTSGSWKDEVKDLAGRDGVQVVFDPVGGEATDWGFRTLGWNGRHLMVGFAGGQIGALKTNLAIVKGASLLGVDFRQVVERDPQVAADVKREVVALHASGHLRPTVHAALPMERFAEAARLVRERATLGRVVLHWRD